MKIPKGHTERKNRLINIIRTIGVISIWVTSVDYVITMMCPTVFFAQGTFSPNKHGLAVQQRWLDGD